MLGRVDLTCSVGMAEKMYDVSDPGLADILFFCFFLQCVFKTHFDHGTVDPNDNDRRDIVTGIAFQS